MPKQALPAAITRVKHSRVLACMVVLAFSATIIIIPLFVLHAIDTLHLGENAQVIAPATTKPVQTSISPAMQETPEANSSPTVISPIGTVYYGVSVPGWLDHLTALTAFEKDAKKQPAIVMWYQGWGSTDGTQNFQITWMDTVRSHGSIPLVTWEPWKPIDYPQGVDQPVYALRNIIDGAFDSYITRWAQASKAWNHPYFLRFAHEMNGNWYPWDEQVNGNKPGEFVQAWRHVHDIFTANGVHNVTWIWSPNAEYYGTIPFSELYPGDRYVDWVGMDGFNWGTTNGTQWITFSQIFKQTYRDLLRMSTKPLMIAETGCAEQGGNKANWITDAYSTQIPHNFPKIKAIIWFNQDKQRDWRIESSTTAQSAFANAIQSSIYASNSFGNY
jgi:hypothetical protein